MATMIVEHQVNHRVNRICPVNQCVMVTGPSGVIHRGVYDGALYWKCPVCAGTWHRWAPGHPLRRRAEVFLGPSE